MMNSNPFQRLKTRHQIQPAGYVYPAGDVKEEAFDAGQQQGQNQNVTNIANAVAGTLGRTVEGIVGVVRSNNEVEIARLNADAATAIAQIQGQLSAGNLSPSQQSALQNQQAMLQLLQSQLRAQQQPDNTMLYIAVAAVLGLGYVYMQRQGTVRRNPTRRTRRRARRSRR